ncbi:ABC transporter substrate-binding protein [Thermus tengchongensis]|uniref:Extracellular solute-binding protein n=1 Tax=Thermus tengchongensis TaxID=1214928 RepID=A0A4Y9FDF2_9DEIN|nr:ABC transporter substrate-binding protein [Thermus tengchongensis]TFU26549.1 extracellular solute-binding protein [Thermus tengchongensis]
MKVIPWLLGASLVLGSASAKDQITLYVAGAQLPDVQALVQAFNQVHPEITVQVFRSGAGEVVAKLRAELETGNPQPDLIWLVGEGFFRELSQRGLLMRIAPTFPGLPPQYVYEGGRYYEVRLLHNIIAVNSRRVRALPKTWADLTKEDYRGQVVMADPNFSGPALVALGYLSDRYGFGFWEAMKRNGMAVEQSNPVLQQKLARGEYSLAITNDYGVRQEIAKGAPLRIVYPQDGVIVAPTPIGIPTWSRRPDLAEKFLRFLLSERGQRVFVERGYLPVLPGIPAPADAPSRLVSVRGREASAEILERFNALFGLRR